VVAGGDACLIAEPLVDVQGAAVQGLGGVVVPPLLGQPPQLVIGGGDACLVADPLEDLQDLTVGALGGVVVAPQLGQDAERKLSRGSFW